MLPLTSIYGQTQAAKTHDVLKPAAERKLAPDFILKSDRGQDVKLSTFRGQVVLLDFWATWCGGCKTEIPWYMEFDSRYRRRGLAVIGIAMDDDGFKVVRPFVRQHQIKYTVVLGDQAVGKQYELGLMPLTLLIDRQGRIALSHAGVVDKADFENAIGQLLR